MGEDSQDFEFYVVYTDADNEPPSPIQVWVDLNDDGDYLDANEKVTMSVAAGEDGNYINGEKYTVSINTLTAGVDNVLKYRFYASDGTDVATGEPSTEGETSDNTVAGDQDVEVYVGYTVRPSGTSKPKDYTSILSAANAQATIIVYPNDDFSAATYSENVVLYNQDNRTLIGACGADYTIISSYSGGSALLAQDGSNFVVDGFSLTGTTSSYTGAFQVNRVDSTTQTIKNCKIYSNWAGIYVNDADNVPVAVENCEIYNNTNYGIYLANADDDVAITNSVIHSHNVSTNGAALCINDGGSANISKSIIRDNTTSSGGVIYVNKAGASLTVSNSIFADNQGTTGAVFNTLNGPTVNVVNSTFATNSATQGGVLYVCQPATYTFRNSIFWGNSASSSGDIAYKACSGFYSNFVTVSYSDVTTSGTNFGNGSANTSEGGNIDPAQDPLFENAAADNYHIQTGSPVIDQASASYAPADDIDGDTRPLGGGDDMGADEKE